MSSPVVSNHTHCVQSSSPKNPKSPQPLDFEGTTAQYDTTISTDLAELFEDITPLPPPMFNQTPLTVPVMTPSPQSVPLPKPSSQSSAAAEEIQVRES